MDPQEIYAAVKERYSVVSKDTTQATGGYGRAVAQSFGYSEEELLAIPSESNLGLSCGNPLAIASLREGETVVDLGSGAGFDVFLAARKVGPSGRAIGVDMNKDMLLLAQRNKINSDAASNVEFVEGNIAGAVPLPDGSADVIISNCVINLVPEPDKQRVFNEMARILKAGGRAAISDILARKPLPESLRKSAAAHVGCVAGASLVGQYESYLKKAGFSDVLIQDAGADLNVYLNVLPDGSKRLRDDQGTANSGQGCCGPAAVPPKKLNSGCCGTQGSPTAAPSEGCSKDLGLDALAADLGDTNLNDWIGSYKIYAVKA